MKFPRSVLLLSLYHYSLASVATAIANRDSLLSLPEIVSGEPTEWSINNVEFTTDGAVLTKPDRVGSGSLWSKHKNSHKEWTAEFRFKVRGEVEYTKGEGLAFWYTANRDATGPIKGSTDFWDGLALFIDYDGWDEFGGGLERGAVKGHLNDGSISYESFLNGGLNAFSYCRLNYRGAAQAIVIRVAYKEGQFVVNINGQNCLQNSKIVLPADEYYFGFSALSAHDEYIVESFNVYPVFEPDSVAETEVTQDSATEVVAEQEHDDVVQEHAVEAQRESSKAAETLQEIERLRNDLVSHMNNLVLTQQQSSSSSSESGDSAQPVFDISPIINRLNEIDTRLAQFEAQISVATSSKDAAFHQKIDAVTAHLDSTVQKINEHTTKILSATFPDGIDAYHAAQKKQSDPVASSYNGPSYWTLLVTFVFSQVIINIGMAKYKERQSRHAKLI